MANPLSFLTRVVRATRPDPVIGRCPVCHENVRKGAAAVQLRGVGVHQECATYRMRQRARLS